MNVYNPEDKGKYARTFYGIKQVDSNIVFEPTVYKQSSDLSKVLQPGDVIVVGGVKYTIFRSKDIMDGDLFIVRIDNDNNPRFTKVSYLVQTCAIDAVLTKEQFLQNCCFIKIFNN